jgi:hypothetical protein
LKEKLFWYLLMMKINTSFKVAIATSIGRWLQNKRLKTLLKRISFVNDEKSLAGFIYNWFLRAAKPCQGLRPSQKTHLFIFVSFHF